MNSPLRQLISISSDPLLPPWNPGRTEQYPELAGIPHELRVLLHLKNGFLALESALHVYPIALLRGRDELDLLGWNDPQGWRGEFGDLIPESLLFFAQDAFGNQFGYIDQKIVTFCAETAEIEPLASTLAEWAELVLAEWDSLCGHHIAREWQLKNRPLCEGERLIPKFPLVLGGQWDVENFYADSIANAMRFRGLLARQIADVPDGTPIKIVVTNPP